MKRGATGFAKTIFLTGIAFAAAVVFIVRPVLAQEDASSSAPVDNPSVSAEPTPSEPTSTPRDTATAESTPSDSSIAPADASSTSGSDSTTNANASPTEAPPAGLTEVHIIGTKYTDYFTDGTTTTAYPGDTDIDAHLSERDAPTPKHEGLTWVHTIGQHLYDTQSGDLEVGEYAIQSNGSLIVNNPFQSSTSTPSTASASSEESSSATSPQVLGASTSSDAFPETTQTPSPVSSTDTPASASDSGQSDTVTAASDSTSSSAQPSQ